MEARPYLGPQDVTVLLKSHNFGTVILDDIVFLANSSNIRYVGENLSIRELSSKSLSLEELPCFICGLSEEDLLANEVWYKILELETLMEFYDPLGLGEISIAKIELDISLQDFYAGRYGDAKSRLIPRMEEVYDIVLEKIWPLVGTGLASPRDSSIPLTSLTRIRTAKEMFSEGERTDGKLYLFAGLKEWSNAVDESACAAVVLVVFLSLMITWAYLRKDDPVISPTLRLGLK